jgi:hypothetical protein
MIKTAASAVARILIMISLEVVAIDAGARASRRAACPRRPFPAGSF